MKSNFDTAKIDRRLLLKTLAGGGATLISVPTKADPEGVFRFAAAGDVVIVTTDRLVAADPGRPPIADLQRRLDVALGDRKVLDYIAGAPSRRFALSSFTFQPFDTIGYLHFQSDIRLQGQIAAQIFGDDVDHVLPVDYPPFYIATAIEDNREVLSCVLDMINFVTSSTGYDDAPLWRNSGTNLTIFSAANATQKPGELDLIALWPFINKA